MGTLILDMVISIDAIAAATDVDLGFHDAGGGLGATTADQLQRLRTCDAILLGAQTYRLFSEFWPTATAQDQPIAPFINATPKHIVSSTLDAAPWGHHEPATVERGDGVDVARRLTREYAGDVVVWGSITLGESLLAADAVDALWLRVVPVLMGTGRPLATGPLPQAPWQLQSSVAYPGGVLGLVYQRHV